MTMPRRKPDADRRSIPGKGRRNAKSRFDAHQWGRTRTKVGTSLRDLAPPPVRAVVPGLIVRTHVHYADAPDRWKNRPAVVVGPAGPGRLLLHPITGAEHDHVGAVRLVDWAAAGLVKPSAVMPRTVDVDAREITGIVGRVSEDDAARLAGRFADMAPAAVSA